MKAMSKSKTWIITASGNRSIDEVSKDLVRVGFVLHATLREVGCIVGSALEKDVAKLRQVQGVADVSPETPIDIGPPDSHNTW